MHVIRNEASTRVGNNIYHFFMLRGICFGNQVGSGMVKVLIKRSKVVED